MPKHVSSLGAKRAFIVADARLSGPRAQLERALKKSGCEVASVSLKAAESTKDYRRLFPLYARMIEAKMDRHSVLFALGGGVIGDLWAFWRERIFGVSGGWECPPHFWRRWTLPWAEKPE